ncbi:MAG: DegV family protein [Chloroflexota bacterium]
MVRIVTDTLSDVTPQMVNEFGIAVVPLHVHFGKETFRDGVDLSTEEFYRRLQNSEVFPTTSAPGPGLLSETFTRLASETTEILAVMASSKLSAVHEAAVQGAQLAQKGCRIEVVDSQFVVGAQLLLVLLAARAASKGSSLDETATLVRTAIPRIQARMSFDTLEYLRRGGRIGKAQAFLGSMLRINPILGLKDGEIVPITRLRGRSRALDWLVSFARSFPKAEGLVVEDATTPEEAETLVARISEFLPKEKIFRSRVGPAIGVHVGPHVLAVSILPAQK